MTHSDAAIVAVAIHSGLEEYQSRVYDLIGCLHLITKYGDLYADILPSDKPEYLISKIIDKCIFCHGFMHRVDYIFND